VIISIICALAFFGLVIEIAGFSFILLILLLSYVIGLIWGIVTRNQPGREEKTRLKINKNRNKRLVEAQEKGEVPCYLKE
jgi:uncharacterized membrane protein (DUF106 family)